MLNYVSSKDDPDVYMRQAVKPCDIQNAYLTAQCREKIWTVVGPEFGSDIGKIFIIKMALYGLKSSGAAFCSLLAETLHELNHERSKRVATIEEC